MSNSTLASSANVELAKTSFNLNKSRSNVSSDMTEKIIFPFPQQPKNRNIFVYFLLVVFMWKNKQKTGVLFTQSYYTTSKGVRYSFI